MRHWTCHIFHLRYAVNRGLVTFHSALWHRKATWIHTAYTNSQGRKCVHPQIMHKMTNKETRHIFRFAWKICSIFPNPRASHNNNKLMSLWRSIYRWYLRYSVANTQKPWNRLVPHKYLFLQNRPMNLFLLLLYYWSVHIKIVVLSCTYGVCGLQTQKHPLSMAILPQIM